MTTIEKTVEIPENGVLNLELKVPENLPTGKQIIILPSIHFSEKR
jgi:hypothetical protein